MLSTTYSKYTEMQLRLPVADTEAQREYPKEITIAVTAEGNYTVNKSSIQGRNLEAISNAIADAAKGQSDTVVIISADANAKHQAVVSVMEAARRAGLSQITFATQSTQSGAQ